MSRVVWCLLVVVATAAAVLSFAGLRDLALLCGFTPALAWLLPLVIDAGAGVSCLAWLGRRMPPDAERFARGLTWTLLAGSVAGNAIVHALTAYSLAAPWWLVVAVSGIAPGVLGAVVHLAVLVGRRGELPHVEDEPVDYWPTELDEHGLSRAWETAPPAAPDRAERLIAAGVGRRRLARELDITEHEARQLLAPEREPRVSAPTRPAERVTGTPIRLLVRDYRGVWLVPATALAGILTGLAIRGWWPW